jgi:hypothetical protein
VTGLSCFAAIMLPTFSGLEAGVNIICLKV